jgi:hypothetical protein
MEYRSSSFIANDLLIIAVDCGHAAPVIGVLNFLKLSSASLSLNLSPEILSHGSVTGLSLNLSLALSQHSEFLSHGSVLSPSPSLLLFHLPSTISRVSLSSQLLLTHIETTKFVRVGGIFSGIAGMQGGKFGNNQIYLSLVRSILSRHRGMLGSSLGLLSCHSQVFGHVKARSSMFGF